MKIHQTATVCKGSIIDESVEIGAYSFIGPKVRIDKGVVIAPYVHITGETIIGENTKIYSFATLGEIGQISNYDLDVGKLYIGKNCVIREYASIHQGSNREVGITKIGDNCFLMNNTHVAHDCIIGNNVFLINNAAIAGHTQVGDYASIGGYSIVGKKLKIGEYAYLMPTSGLIKNLPPYSLGFGKRAKVIGVNIKTLRLNRFQNDFILNMSQIFKKLSIKEQKQNIQEIIKEFDIDQNDNRYRLFIDFMMHNNNNCDFLDRKEEEEN